MAVYFLDSSALVKRYVVETHSKFISDIVRPSAQNLVFVARIAGPEVIAALARKRKGNHLTPAEAERAIRRFQKHFSLRYQKISITDEILTTAMSYADTYGLRGYDSVQLAAAVAVEMELDDAGSPPLIFVSFDKDLNFAARGAGLVVPDGILESTP